MTNKNPTLSAGALTLLYALTCHHDYKGTHDNYHENALGQLHYGGLLDDYLYPVWGIPSPSG
jgi:hypothetical protein